MTSKTSSVSSQRSSTSKLVLASTSPRRIEFLGRAGIPFEAVKPLAEETQKKGESPSKMVKRLAKDKAISVLHEMLPRHPDVVVIGADTTVVSPRGKLLGKPRSPNDACRMLGELSGRTHTVLTGYCICIARGGKIRAIERVVQSKVRIKKLSKDVIRQYVETEEPMDKAGAYAAQGIGMMLIEEIKGSYTNVVGLPMAQLITDLEKLCGAKLQLKRE